MGDGDGMTYKESGVDYGQIDPFKRKAQAAARETDVCIERLGFKVVPWTHGESVTLIKMPWGYLALVVEGLGTKSLVADALYQLTVNMESLIDRSFYDNVAQCSAAMAFNDIITLGASPIGYGQYLAVGDSGWFNDERRRHDLIEGTKKACILARCAWLCGETPTLAGIIMPRTADLAGATIGVITNKDHLINPVNIQHGDSIIFLGSSGIHANGLTLARKIADKLPDGYLTKLSDGRTYGESLLDATHIYVAFIEDCLNAGVDIHYAVNITGHGWRKLMRALGSFAYIIEKLPPQLPIFDFIQKHGPVDEREMYGNFNMGAGFAIYVPDSDVEKVFQVFEKLYKHPFPFGILHAGHIEKSDEKKVVIVPKDIEFSAEELNIRG
jgi:phosphoribosylformylglycinamidine cyclo-ligase